MRSTISALGSRFAPPLRLGLVALAWSCGPAAGPEPANVILIVVDTLRADHLTDYGHDRDTLGPVAGLASQSTRFTAAYAPASWTRPSVATVFSGMMPARHRAKIGGTNRLNRAIPTLAEALREAGFSTAGFSANVVVSRKSDFDQGFARFMDYEGGVQAYPDIEAMIRLARDWVRTAERPFFLFLQPMNAHGPYRVPPEYQKLLLGRRPSEEFRYQHPPRTTVMEGALDERSEISESYLASLRDQYDTAIRYSMEKLGLLFDDLRRGGVWDESLVILTSDHGEELFDHGGFNHAYTLFEEVVRVPLYVKLPGQREGAVRADRVSLADIYPTVLDVLGLPPARHVDGRSMLRASDADRELVFELNNRQRFLGRALLSGSFKLVETVVDYQHRDNEIALYDLTQDPAERQDLAAERPELVNELRARMEEIFSDYESRALPLPTEADAELDQETLRALGYVN